MKTLNDLKEKARNIPEFSEKNYHIAGYIVAALITLTGLFLIYEVLSTDSLTFKANWNLFKSPLGNLCLFVGLVLALVNWGKFGHWSSTPVIETRDKFTGELIERKENYDITEQLMYQFILPLLGHFIIEPIIYAALIYYPIQCIVALVGAIFPYILSLIVLAIIVGAWLFTRNVTMRYRSALLVVCGIVFTLAFGWGGYSIMRTLPGGTIQMLVSDNSEQLNNAGIITNDTVGYTDGMALEEEMEDQFEGYGEEGLFGSLPIGTILYEGEMGQYPIEFTIINEPESGLKAIYKNVNNGTTIEMDGESLPADGGEINFYGNDGNASWVFNLTGDANNITGTASSDNKAETLKLKRK